MMNRVRSRGLHLMSGVVRRVCEAVRVALGEMPGAWNDRIEEFIEEEHIRDAVYVSFDAANFAGVVRQANALRDDVAELTKNTKHDLMRDLSVNLRVDESRVLEFLETEFGSILWALERDEEGVYVDRADDVRQVDEAVRTWIWSRDFVDKCHKMDDERDTKNNLQGSYTHKTDGFECVAFVEPANLNEGQSLYRGFSPGLRFTLPRWKGAKPWDKVDATSFIKMFKGWVGTGEPVVREWVRNKHNPRTLIMRSCGYVFVVEYEAARLTVEEQLRDH